MKLKILIIPFFTTSISVGAIENETIATDNSVLKYMDKQNTNYLDKSSIDCLTDTHAYEADWADGLKVYESIGQSLYYAAETNKKSVILLLIRKKDSDKYIRKVKRVIENWNLPIKLIIQDVR